MKPRVPTGFSKWPGVAVLATCLALCSCDSLDLRPGYLLTAEIEDLALWTDETRLLELGDHFEDPDGGGLNYSVSWEGEAVLFQQASSSLWSLRPETAGQVTVTVRAETVEGIVDTDEFIIAVRDLCQEGGLGTSSLFPFQEGARWTFTETTSRSSIGNGGITEAGEATWTFEAFNCETASGVIRQHRQGSRRGGGISIPSFQEAYDETSEVLVTVGAEALELSILDAAIDLRREDVVDGLSPGMITGGAGLLREEVLLSPGVGIETINRNVIPVLMGACCFSHTLVRTGAGTTGSERTAFSVRNAH